MKKVGLLDAHTIQTLSIAKSLKSMGFFVILFCETKNSYGYFTKYADKKIITPSLEKDNTNFNIFFKNYLKEENIDVIIPLFDMSARYLSFHKEEISKYTKFIIPDYDVFMSGYDKNKFMQICQSKGFPHPKTFDLSVGTLEQSIKFTGTPALIKPNITYGARGFALVNSISEIKEKLPNIISNFGKCHLQEFIPQGGKQYLVGIYIHKRSLINSTVVDKLRFYPVKGGSSCFNKSVQRDDLVSLCFEVLKELKWNGYAHFDLIEDPRDGIIKIMELNPRVQGCIKSSSTSGVNFTENIINASFNLPLQKHNFIPGSYLRFLGLDLLWFLTSKDRFKTSPSWFSGLLDSNNFFQDGSWDDLKPLIFGNFANFVKQLNPNFREAKKGMN